jgi:hypothetical protein
MIRDFVRDAYRAAMFLRAQADVTERLVSLGIKPEASSATA